MNSFITSVGTGGSATNPLPYVFIVTDGSQDYQTHSGSSGAWGSENWTANGSVPHPNSATVIPPNSEQTHRLLWRHEKPRHHGGGPLYSL